MPTSDSKADLAFKKSLRISQTSNTLRYFEEPFKSNNVTYSSDVWGQDSLIPTIAPGNPGAADPTPMTDLETRGVIKRYIDHTLTAITGSSNSFQSDELINAIPYNYDTTPNVYSYMIELKDSLNNPIPFTQGDWVVDNGSGVLHFHLTPPVNVPPKISFYKYVGTTVSDTLGIIGDPTTGGYSTNVGIVNTDTIADSVQKLDVLADRIFPIAPGDINSGSITLTLATAQYSAIAADTFDTPHSNVTTGNSPGPSTNVTSAFMDGDNGVLKALVDNGAGELEQGSITLTTADDTGTNDALEIVSDSEAFPGVSQQEGFYKTLTARLNPPSGNFAPSATQQYSYKLRQEFNGGAIINDTPILQFHLNTPSTPSISAQSITGSSVPGGFVSGVATLLAGENLNITLTITDAIKEFYHSTNVATFTGDEVITTNYVPTGASANTNPSPVVSVPLAASKFNLNAQVTCQAFAADGTASTTVDALGSVNVRVDTLSLDSNEATLRVESGNGQYPTFGTGAGQFGDTFVPATSLATTEELQLLGGLFQYPPLTNYAGQIPAGPDYSSLAGGSFNNLRWVVFPLGAITFANSFKFQFNSPANFGSDTIIGVNETDFALQLLVRNAGTPANGTAGWVDANAAFSGVSSPTANGDPALVLFESSSTVKYVTFGQTAREGDVYVRVGLSPSSTIQFSSVTAV